MTTFDWKKTRTVALAWNHVVLKNDEKIETRFPARSFEVKDAYFVIVAVKNNITVQVLEW